MEGELDGTVELPTAQVQGEARAVGEHQKLVRLVAGDWVEFYVQDFRGRVFWLRQGDAGVVGIINANGPCRVGDAVGEVPVASARFDELIEQVADACGEGLVASPR